MLSKPTLHVLQLRTRLYALHRMQPTRLFWTDSVYCNVTDSRVFLMLSVYRKPEKEAVLAVCFLFFMTRGKRVDSFAIHTLLNLLKTPYKMGVGMFTVMLWHAHTYLLLIWQ